MYVKTKFRPDFVPNEVQGGVDNTIGGAVVSAELRTHRNKLVIIATVNGRTMEDLTDPNAILDGHVMAIGWTGRDIPEKLAR